VVLWEYASGKYITIYRILIYTLIHIYTNPPIPLQGIRPYSHIPERDLNKQDRVARQRASTIVRYLEQLVVGAEPRLLPAGVDVIRRLDMPTNDRVFSVVYQALLGRLYNVEEVNTVRKGELAYATVYKKLCIWDVHGHIVRKRKR